MWALTGRDVVDLVLLAGFSLNTASRWIQRRENNDKTLTEKVAELKAAADEKADAAYVQELDDKIDTARVALEGQLKDVGDWYRAKFAELHAQIGRLATLRDVDLLRQELNQLRARVDQHFDKGVR